MRTLRPQSLRLLSSAGIILSVCFFVAGCGLEHGHDDGTDESFIRVPGTPESLPMPAGTLLPLRTGARWSMVTRTLSRDTSHNSTGSEEMIILGKQPSVDGIVMDMRHAGKSYRQEVFVDRADGLYLSAAGAADKMTINPPLALVKYPVKDGAAESWTGVLRFKSTAAPGTAYSRVSAREMVKTPAGSFPAYRIDTVISTTVEGRPAAFPSSRWFSPNVGIVRQVLQAGDLRLVKELKTYHIP